jgi:hypothetical protein
MLERLLTRRTFLPLLAVACLAAYLPAFNNGFISDDYVTLDWAGKFFAHPGFLFTVPPQNFRMTSYVVFELLKRAFGYNSIVWYAVNTAFHFINCVLLWRLLIRLEDRLTAGLATLLFAVFQQPQEAVMWLSAMNETLATIFILSALILWTRSKHGWGLLCYTLALISKESAPILLLLIPLVQWRQRKPLFTPAYLLYFIPSAVFAVVFLNTWTANTMIHYQFYAVSPHALVVLGITLHRLLWPWIYVLAALAMIWGALRPTLRGAATAVGLIVLPMLPYIFLTYAKSLPSRQLYLACMVFMVIAAALIQQVKVVELRSAAVAVFCLWNVFYLWTTKDRQFMERAAPTTELLHVLQTRPPQQIRVDGFPYPVTEIARDVSFLVPGWSPDMIHADTECGDCLVLTWNSSTRSYR